MRSHPAGLIGLLAACLAAASPASSHAATDSTLGGPPLTMRSGTMSWENLCLGRAAMEQSLGNTPGVIRHLEGIDFTNPSPSFTEVDRAAFLLGQAYLRAGSAARFATLARAVAAWEKSTAYTQWLALELRIAEAAGSVTVVAPAPDTTELQTQVDPGALVPGADAESIRRIGFGAADALAASLLLRDGDVEGARRLLSGAEAGTPESALEACLEALAGERAGQDTEAALARMSAADTTSALGRDLAGLALIRRAARAAARSEDPRPLLAAVPRGSRYEARALHMAWLAGLERGDLAAEARLDSLGADSTYESRREILMALAGRALENGQWQAAHRRYAAIDRDWSLHREALRGALESDRADSLWAQWQSSGEGQEALLLDALPARRQAEQIARASANLGVRAESPPPTLIAPPTASRPRWPLPPPSAEEWRSVSAARSRAAEAAEDVRRADQETIAERARLEDLRRYLGMGLERQRLEHASIRALAARLDSLAAMLLGIDARIKAVRDETQRRVAQRSAQLLELARIQRTWVLALRHFHIEGPNQPWESLAPYGYPSTDSLTREERRLNERLQALTERLSAETPDLLDRSYQHAWRPNVIDRGITNREEAHRLLAWAVRLQPAIAKTIDSAMTSPALLALQRDAARRAVTRDSLQKIERALAKAVARSAVERALATLESEREGIDYGLAVAAYAASVRLAAADSSASDSARTASGATAAADSAHRGLQEEADDPESAAWRAQAIASLQTFLERHRGSAARGEMRFRLADLLLVDARQNFRARMADFLARQESGAATGALPVMDPTPALRLYRAILAEDPGFERRDAVLFNAAMLLADQGDPEAGKFFAQLVRDDPGSSYAQESYLRMGDLAFNEKRFSECVPLYQQAAAGSDISLKAIALYKLGWAHFNAERLDDAAGAFRAVLDVYESKRELKINVDIEGEAESYLVHSLARAGGAKAFGRHFDASGGRPYERRVLRDLAHHFRRYSLYGEAAEVEQLYIERYPLEPEALASAQRLPETYERWDHADLARKSRLEFAPRFAPGSEWHKAQSSDSVKAAGASFARSAWLSVALEHHRAARQKDAREDWSEALRLYRTLLDHWPQDSMAASYRLVAGEASQHLGDFRGALEYYGQAAGGPDSVARQAVFQRVAVTDAWYESTRGAGASGRDSLAKAVLSAGDEMLTRYPDHAAATDVSWRLGNLAFAHGWYERATQDFERMVTKRPGDSRAPTAAALRADALFHMKDFEKAGAAFEVAQKIAHEAGRDSLEKRAAAAIPVCYFRAAEALAASDSTAYGKQAALFEQVAGRWPKFEHAHVAQYRAGLAWLEAGKTREGVKAMEALIQNFPRSEYVKDAHLQVAKAWESDKHPVEAADAYIGFARAFPKDSSAAAAWLKSADLLQGAGQQGRADDLRLSYVKSHPGDVETAMEVFEGLARRDLTKVGPERPISMLLDPETPAATKKAQSRPKKAQARTAAPDTAKARSYLAEYLRRGKAHPRLLSQDVVAQVRYLQGEEARTTYLAARLTQPLEKSIPTKQKLLDSTLARYRASVDIGGSEWSSASAYRIGEALVAFGEALEKSERPADLKGDDLLAYEDVILEQSQPFYDRGEEVWTDLLRERGKEEKVDPWVTQARDALWKRLGSRFYFRPEAEFPAIAGTAPEPIREKPARKAAAADSGKKSTVHAQREEQEP
ncbi:MAG TPA: tetratricopeptide repeat protein [Candidatus Eisenbacteria bacterium]|nr:tetratricopeptide repeat protein [Candidatus Eisenbacteria bacterium]